MNVEELNHKSIITGDIRPEFLQEETLVDLFNLSVIHYPNKAVLIFDNTQLTYSQLDKWSTVIANYLIEKGIGKGSFVVVWLPRGLALHATIIGIIKSGAAYVPVDSEMPAERVEVVIAEVNANACFNWANLNTTIPLLPAIPLPQSTEAVKLITKNYVPDSFAYVLYTSGSTGKPKGIPITHRQICHLVRSEQSVLGIQSTDKVYQGFSVSFDMWCEETWISYFAGATLWVADNATSKAIDELGTVLNQQKITVLHAVPSLLAVIEEDVPTLRIINSGGEACTVQVLNKWAKEGRKLYNSYGPTETTVSATFIALNKGDKITIGYPLPNYNLGVVDEHKNIVPKGERGELIISGPGVSDGYINLAELTEKKFINKCDSLSDIPGDRFYCTGDAVIINEDNTIEFLGRFDDQIKLRGYRIELGEIETKLQQLDNISAAAVAVKKDPAGQEHLIGYVISEVEVVDEENILRTALAKVLPSYMVPEAIVFVKEMPRMPSGKIDRRNLPMPDFFKDLIVEQKAIDINASVDDKIIAALKISFPGKEINLSQDFFTDLGGHSLLAAGFVSRIRKEAGITHASLKDIYLHRPLTALADIWRKEPQTKTSTESTFKTVPKLRYYLCWIAQTIASLFIFGIFTVQVFGPFVSYYYMSEEYSSYAIGIASAYLFYCSLPFFLTAVVIFIKWLVIGKMKEGDYPLWGTYYFRWWFVKTLQKMLPLDYISGTPLFPLYLRLFGVKVAGDAQLSSLTMGAEDLITIDSDASLSSQVVFDNACIEDGWLKLRSIHVGKHCYIGSSAVIGANTKMADYCELQDLSYLPANTKTNIGEVWYGSPGQLKETKSISEIPMPEMVSARRKIFYSIAFFLINLIFPVFVLTPLIPVIIALHAMDNASADYNFSYMVVVPVLAFLYMLLFGLETVIFSRILNYKIKEGQFPIYSSTYLKKWLSDQFMNLSLMVMHPLFATVYISAFFRLLGAKVGKNTEISTASSVTHSLLEIGEGSFVADAVTLGEADVRAQRLILSKTTIQDNSFVGNSALIPQGYNLPSNMLIGVLSVPPTKEQLENAKAADWFGSPSIALPRRQESNPFPKELTMFPSFPRKIARGTIEFIRIILPESIILCCSILFIAYGHDLIVDNSVSYTILMLPFYYLAFVGIPLVLITVALKWIFVGKYKEEQHPMWTAKVWLSEAVTATYESLCVPFLLYFLEGTPWLPVFLRMFGTKIGKRVCMNTTDITEYDMVTIGTDSVLNDDSGPQTHLFEDRVMKIGRIVIGERCSIGTRTIILYDTVIANDVKVDSLSLIMKGEVLSDGTYWTGSPIRPV